jgi:hypothetical protein
MVRAISAQVNNAAPSSAGEALKCQANTRVISPVTVSIAG